MPTYKGVVTTGNRLGAWTWDHVYVTLVGTKGESRHEDITTRGLTTGSDFTFEVKTEDIGKLVLIKLQETRPCWLPEKAWFPAKIVITSDEQKNRKEETKGKTSEGKTSKGKTSEGKTSDGETYHFPIHRWITNQEVQVFREGTACLVFDDTNAKTLDHRKKELELRKEQYCWSNYKDGIPDCVKIDSAHSLPNEIRFSFTKAVEFKFTALSGLIELKLKGLADRAESWSGIDAISKVFSHKQTPLSEHVLQNWRTNSLFGSQFLNGVNPMVIRCCKKLPENLPITNSMVFLPDGRSLKKEMQRGNIFLCDYKVLDGLDANTINGKKQYLMAPLLKQKSSKDNPIFFPTDSTYDWLLVKMFVRSADFNDHQLNSHLLRTHLLAEVFSVSLLRNLPMVHPLYKFLVPHTRYTLQINILARKRLISDEGVFNLFTSSGGKAMLTILQRATSSITYTSLCIRDDIKERGLESVPNFFYRDDGFQIWDIIHKFVQGVLGSYYKNNSSVRRDTELQEWVQDIFKHGFLSRSDSGMPQKLRTVAELVKFVTMVIFTGSAQHAAINGGQFDYGSWMPNMPTTIQSPPPAIKGRLNDRGMVDALPDINTTVHGMAVLHLLSKQSSDFVPLGHYPEEHFSEKKPCEHMETFKVELRYLSDKIHLRNKFLTIPYTFLDPLRKMPTYKGVVTTGNRLGAWTWDHVYVTLVGTKGESRHEDITTRGLTTGSDFTFEVKTEDIGKLVLIKLQETRPCWLPEKAWFPAKIVITSDEQENRKEETEGKTSKGKTSKGKTSEGKTSKGKTSEGKTSDGETYHFPIHRWITNQEVQVFREGTACLVFDDTNAKTLEHRKKELELRKEHWSNYKDGIPDCVKIDSAHSLPNEIRFSFTKAVEFKFTALSGLIELKLKGLADRAESWSGIDAISKVFSHKQTPLSEHVLQNWRTDSLFSSQFLNGVNPMVIRCCKKLPENLPITNSMVFLPDGRSLKKGMQRGNIFLCDYKVLDGLDANTINGKKQYLMAPLVLLHRTPSNELKPIAIQLKQKSSKDNPIFFPTDSTYDWLLVKMFVRSADFNVHQLNSHLLRTHLLAEVFSVSLLRNLPMVHPLYKLLIPHTRYTLQINILARKRLISDEGVFNLFTSSGGKAMLTILQRATSSITYTSLCIKDDIKERGLESVPNFFYRDDGFQIWDIIHKFVQGVLHFYYKNDSSVRRDTELQEWVQDIFKHGFLSRSDSGMPQKLRTVAELVKFVTMVIFTGSAQHAAVNSGQFDYGSWMPNMPTTIQSPPPAIKGHLNDRGIMDALPDINTTVRGMAVLHLLSKQSSDFVPLGHYPEEHFSEKKPCEHMETFKVELRYLSDKINLRNKRLTIPYTFLDPLLVENSVAI
ncbi:Arachidonate 15-lipoxygenase B [Merluccius polli]|uniref:Arachidonate 15-lipoxygenase B n=1 Tax=Merluccius polli TaxID=89951 RepID=A0AA47N785_MERPO|nr:Arachidonate 15-lipoxygenase B [Merluccius polli]